MYLLLTPFCAGVVLVEAGQVPVVALVQCLVPDRLQTALADDVEDDLAGLLRPRKSGGIGDVEGDTVVLERPGTVLGLPDAELRQPGVLPAGEEVLQVPFALAVADKDKGSGHDGVPRF